MKLEDAELFDRINELSEENAESDLPCVARAAAKKPVSWTRELCIEFLDENGDRAYQEITLTFDTWDGYSIQHDGELHESLGPWLEGVAEAGELHILDEQADKLQAEGRAVSRTR